MYYIFFVNVFIAYFPRWKCKPLYVYFLIIRQVVHSKVLRNYYCTELNIVHWF